MKTFLFVIVDGGGNVSSQMSIARRLAARGHAVHVLGDRTIEFEATRAGCSFHPFVHAPQHTMRSRAVDTVRDWEPSAPPLQVRRIGERLMFGPAGAYAKDVLDTTARVRPDAIAVDCLLFGAMIGAEKSGVPSAVIAHFLIHPPVDGVTPFGLGLQPANGVLGHVRDRLLIAIMRRMFAFGRAPMNAARRALGMEPLAHVFEQFGRLSRRLILAPREFDFVPKYLPPSVQYVGAQLDDPAWVAGWSNPWADDDAAPLVVASLGSTYQRQEKTFAAIVEALGRLPVRGLATHAFLDPPEATPPTNVSVTASVPHTAVLPHASAAICHGGLNTVMKALSHGVPVLVLPFGRDQKDTGARLAASGAGLTLPSSVPPAAIAGAVRRLLDEPQFREQARRMAAIIRRDTQDDRAVKEMEALAGVPADAERKRVVRSMGSPVANALCD
jgi:MGT family glycosyltransferase